MNWRNQREAHNRTREQYEREIWEPAEARERDTENPLDRDLDQDD